MRVQWGGGRGGAVGSAPEGLEGREAAERRQLRQGVLAQLRARRRGVHACGVREVCMRGVRDVGTCMRGVRDVWRENRQEWRVGGGGRE